LLIPIIVSSACGILFMLAVSAITWSRVPNRMVVHFSYDGRPDRYASKAFGLLAMPVTVVALTALVCLLLLVELNRGGLRQSARATLAIWIIMMLVLAMIHVYMVLYSIHRIRLRADEVTAIGLGLVLIVAGVVMPKTKQNRVIEIRTPWTLRSEQSWHRTQRLGGALFAVAGVVILIAAIAEVTHVLILATALVVGIAAITVGYSWWASRHQSSP
jgi:uncharacterized membrane protein